ncbi:hypothetical protein NDU88_003225 [Pleurodeles waltl]|uniref:Uncharacterized protein n=1 Tax=Pleurodeles waltl TaxID=8319 RepID=A0AAV7P8X0_PLEWA|nr:hypothetical protein NDU88_003225 [Pleurodeles waltl]
MESRFCCVDNATPGFSSCLKRTTDFARRAPEKKKPLTETNGRKTDERRTPGKTGPVTTPWRRRPKLDPSTEPKDANSATSQEGRG